MEPVDEKAINFVGKFSADGQSLESTKFQIGWSLTHYNRTPASDRVGESSLSEEDKKTKAILIACADLIPYSRVDQKGFHTAELVKAATRSEVVRALGRIGLVSLWFY